MSLLKKINEISDNGKVRKAWFGLALTILVFLIIIPSVFVVTKIFTEWDLVNGVLRDAAVMAQITGAVWNSFSIAFIVTIIDIIVGIPMAWILVRKQFRGKKYLDTLMDMPLAFPTAVLGLSVVMFWGAPAGISIPGTGLVMSPYIMVIMLHIIFTYPYMVRSLSAILEQIEPNYETAAMTLGASKFSAVRTITLPLFRAGLVTGFILCFARSLSETGGTYIALSLMKMEKVFFTGPTFISESSGGMGPTIVISVIMILLALLMLFLVKRLMMKIKLPMTKVWPRFERRLSRGAAPKMKDLLSIVFLAVIVLLPTFYIFSYLTQPFGAIDYGSLLKAIGMSFMIAGVAVVFDVIFGLPMALYIARHHKTRFGMLLDNLVNIPLIIPTTALGTSLALFWGGANTSGATSILLVILGHIAFTYPLVVRNIIGAVEEVDPSYEEVAQTLGAKPFQAFTKVLLPIIKSSVIAGGILAFTRSLGETGATLAINRNIMTVPVYIVNLVKASNYSEAAICSIVLIVICFVFMLLVRKITYKGDKRA
ncbi:MAG: iron ABC transporter permease [Candidatus Methanomethylophilaceae archaeon]|nr:iron ABC transporter permease [Candidatus Methanomethylophilaceae archaeon]